MSNSDPNLILFSREGLLGFELEGGVGGEGALNVQVGIESLCRKLSFHSFLVMYDLKKIVA